MRELDISICEVCKSGYKVIVSTEDFTEIQAIHYGTLLLAIRYTESGIYKKRASRQYSNTDKKVMKAVCEEWRKIPVTESSELTRIGE